MTRTRVLQLSAVALAAALLTACGGTSSDGSDGGSAVRTRPAAPSPTASATPTADDSAEASVHRSTGRRVYVAVGASETVGVGARRPATQAWPRVLHDQALRDTEYVNVGVSGATVGEALSDQLPRALAADPDVVTVWLAVNDITHLVPVEAYEQQLRTLVHALRQDGRTTVLVGNVPAVQDLPAYRDCLPGAPDTSRCALPVVPPEQQVAATVAAFNQAVDRVVRSEGAVLVDLSQGRDLNRLTSDDGFHPSTRGHRLVARTFAHALED